MLHAYQVPVIIMDAGNTAINKIDTASTFINFTSIDRPNKINQPNTIKENIHSQVQIQTAVTAKHQSWTDDATALGEVSGKVSEQETFEQRTEIGKVGRFEGTQGRGHQRLKEVYIQRLRGSKRRQGRGSEGSALLQKCMGWEGEWRKRSRRYGQGQMMWDLAEHVEDIGIYSTSKAKLMKDFKLGNNMIPFASFEDHFSRIRWGYTSQFLAWWS